MPSMGIRQSPYCHRVYILIRRDGLHPNKQSVSGDKSYAGESRRVEDLWQGRVEGEDRRLE